MLLPLLSLGFFDFFVARAAGAGAEAAGVAEAEAEEAEAEEADAEEADAEEPDAEVADAEEADTEEADADEAEPEEAEAEAPLPLLLRAIPPSLFTDSSTQSVKYSSFPSERSTLVSPRSPGKRTSERDHWKFKDRDETKNRNFAFVLVTFLL